MNQNKKERLLRKKLNEALEENELIAAERFKLMHLIESMLTENTKLDTEIEHELTKIESAKLIHQSPPEESPKVTVGATVNTFSKDSSKLLQQPSKFFVGSIPYQVDQVMLTKYFTSFGEVIDMFIIKGERYGFVTFSSLHNEDLFLKKAHRINGKLIKVERERFLKKSVVHVWGHEVENLTDDIIKEFFTNLSCKVISIRSGDANGDRLIEFDCQTVDRILSRIDCCCTLFET